MAVFEGVGARLKAGLGALRPLARPSFRQRAAAEGASPEPRAPRLKAPLGGFGGLFSGGDRARRLYGAENPDAAPPDPAKLFARHEPFAGDGAPRDLHGAMQASAHRVAERKDTLRHAAREVGKALRERSEGAAFLDAQMFRFLIASAWLAAAMLPLWPFIAATFTETPPEAGAMTRAEARSVAWLFVPLAGAGLIAAILPMLVGAVAGSFTNDRIMAASRSFGRRVAEMLKDLDGELRACRDALTDERKSDSDVAGEIARAHVAAQEAALLFDELDFLIDEESDERDPGPDAATGRYGAWLYRGGGASFAALDRAYWAGIGRGLLAGVLLGALLGAAWVMAVLNVRVEAAVSRLGLGFLDVLRNFPLGLWALPAGAILFVFASEFGRFTEAAFGGGERARRLADSLRAVRSALVAHEAPRARDIARRVEDLSEIFRARVARKSAPRSSASQAGDGRGGEAEPPIWRRGPEAPRFVETGFPAAPKTWRADPHLGPAPGENENFSRRETGAKRRLFSLKKPDEA